MNTGIISSRYATALLKLTQETGRGEQVCAQILRMLADPDTVPSPLEPDLEKFIAFLVEKKRIEYLRFIFHTFVKRYFESNGIKFVKLTSAFESDGLGDRIREMLEKQLGCKVIVDSKVDPELIGGFVLEVDDYMLDASAKRQLDVLRRQLAIKNNRIV